MVVWWCTALGVVVTLASPSGGLAMLPQFPGQPATVPQLVAPAGGPAAPQPRASQSALEAPEPVGTPDTLEAPEPLGTPEEYGLPANCGTTEKARWEKQERFCKAYAVLGSFWRAEKAASIHWSTRTYWVEHDIYGFRRRMQAAQEAYTAYWEAHMDSRLEDPKGNRGSDILLMFKLKALNPAKYRETITLQPSSDTKELLDVFRKLGAASRAARSVDAEVRELGPETSSK